VGAYCHDGETFTAFTRLGRTIGVFPTLHEALQAIGGAR
jgi:hypothetical protein